MKDFFREIKYAYQRVRYGYDERLLGDIEGYFHQFIKPIKEFCEEQLILERHQETDEKRIEIFSTTLDLICKYDAMEAKKYYKKNN